MREVNMYPRASSPRVFRRGDVDGSGVVHGASSLWRVGGMAGKSRLILAASGMWQCRHSGQEMMTGSRYES